MKKSQHDLQTDGPSIQFKCCCWPYVTDWREAKRVINLWGHSPKKKEGNFVVVKGKREKKKER